MSCQIKSCEVAGCNVVDQMPPSKVTIIVKRSFEAPH